MKMLRGEMEHKAYKLRVRGNQQGVGKYDLWIFWPIVLPACKQNGQISIQLTGRCSFSFCQFYTLTESLHADGWCRGGGGGTLTKHPNITRRGEAPEVYGLGGHPLDREPRHRSCGRGVDADQVRFWYYALAAQCKRHSLQILLHQLLGQYQPNTDNGYRIGCLSALSSASQVQLGVNSYFTWKCVCATVQRQIIHGPECSYF